MLFMPSLSDIQTIYLTSYPLYKSDTLNHLQAKYKPYGIRYIIQYKNNTTKVTPTLLKESVKTTTFSLTFADRGSKGLRKRKDYGRTQNFFQRVATFYVTGGQFCIIGQSEHIFGLVVRITILNQGGGEWGPATPLNSPLELG